MSEAQPSPERSVTLQTLNRRFFGTWSEMHVDEIDEAEFLDWHPAQSVNCFKTPSVLPSPELQLEDLSNRLELIIRSSFENQDDATVFLNMLQQPYLHEGGDGRSIVQYLVEKYISCGKNVCGIAIHADKGLTDIPRATGAVKLALAKEYGEAFLSNVGEVASPTLKFQKYRGIPNPDALAIVGNVVWLPPSTENTDLVLKKSGLSLDDFAELMDYVNRGGGRALFEDLRTKNGRPGHVYFVSPPGSRAKRQLEGGRLVSVTAKQVPQEAANMVGRFDAFWPFTIIEDKAVFGPIIDMPKRIRHAGRDYQYLQNVEDAVEINTRQIDFLLQRPGTAKYDRRTKRGEIYRSYQRTKNASGSGNIAAKAASI